MLIRILHVLRLQYFLVTEYIINQLYYRFRTTIDYLFFLLDLFYCLIIETKQ